MYILLKFTELIYMIVVYILLLFDQCKSETFVRQNMEVPFKQKFRGDDIL